MINRPTRHLCVFLVLTGACSGLPHKPFPGDADAFVDDAQGLDVNLSDATFDAGFDATSDATSDATFDATFDATLDTNDGGDTRPSDATDARAMDVPLDGRDASLFDARTD